MIVYYKLFELMKTKGITKYRLRKDKVIGTATLDKMRMGEGNVDTRSIDRLCEYLECQPGDIMEYIKPEDSKWKVMTKDGDVRPTGIVIDMDD